MNIAAKLLNRILANWIQTAHLKDHSPQSSRIHPTEVSTYAYQ
jgi:hypothetical protein